MKNHFTWSSCNVGCFSSNKVVETAMTVPPNTVVDAETYVYKSKVVNEQIEIIPDWFLKMLKAKLQFILQEQQRLLIYSCRLICSIECKDYTRRQDQWSCSLLKPSLLLQRLVMKKLCVVRSRKGNQEHHCRCGCRGYKVSETEVVSNGPKYRYICTLGVFR